MKRNVKVPRVSHEVTKRREPSKKNIKNKPSGMQYQEVSSSTVD